MNVVATIIASQCMGKYKLKLALYVKDTIKVFPSLPRAFPKKPYLKFDSSSAALLLQLTLSKLHDNQLES